MELTSLTLQGTIISSEIIQRIRAEEEKFQAASHFGLESRVTVRDEIGLAWADARRFWAAFSARRDRLRPGESGQTDTRKYWLIPLLGVLGYELSTAPPHVEAETGRQFPVSHRDNSRMGLPIHLVGIGEGLDAKPERGRSNLSPHSLTQDCLNSSEHAYGLVSNGALLRLLRDSSRLSRLSFLEFNLEKMMTEELFSDFSLLYRLLHASRMPKSPESLEESYIEHYHVESLSSGARIRERLSRAVESSIKELGNGLLRPVQNARLRSAADEGSLTAEMYYAALLRLVYRLLFLIVIEERNLVYADTTDPQQRRFRDIYMRFYSILRLRKLAEHHRLIDGNKYDLWQGLMATFHLFEDAQYARRIGLQPLGTGLFDPKALEQLKDHLLPNSVTLKVIRNLSFFENAQGQPTRVNYGDLDVEEFGSVYEGLLEYEPVFAGVNGSREFHFKKGTDRSSSGSHYTPEDLVKPLITHSLDHLIAEKLAAPDPEAGLLSLRVADVACGSGHILLSAARRIGFNLARVREGKVLGLKYPVEQPSPTHLRAAIRDVISRCIYGVDRNPMAVELCKVALWLEAHNPGEPLGFLDHHIKCGDAIVGLAHASELREGIPDQAFTTIHGDDKALATRLRQQNKRERGTRGQQSLPFSGKQDAQLANYLQQYAAMEQMPESSPSEIAAKHDAFQELANSEGFAYLKLLADVQVAQYFIPKQPHFRASLVTDEEYFRMLDGSLSPSRALREQLEGFVAEQRFFHWFLEFPEVFGRGGFDCILGNPPFLGGLRISTMLGSNYKNALIGRYPRSVGGTTDLVAYFILRGFYLTRKSGFTSLISSNTISKGDTRRSSLEFIYDNASIVHAIPSKRWPGTASVFISILTIFKGQWAGRKILNEKQVNDINSYLGDVSQLQPPQEICENKGRVYKGAYPMGSGFLLEASVAQALIMQQPLNQEVLIPFFVGEDINRLTTLAPKRYALNFRDWNEEKCRNEFEEIFTLLESRIRHERALATTANLREKWWQFASRATKLYDEIENMSLIMAACTVTKHLTFLPIKREGKWPIFDISMNIFPIKSMSIFAIHQSSWHTEWAWEFGSKMRFDLRYTTKDCVENFPLPEKSYAIESHLTAIGEDYHTFRAQLMLDMQWGLTKTYNLFHSKPLRVVTQTEWEWDDERFQKELGKDALALRKHLLKSGAAITFNEVVTRIAQLRQLHVTMDQAVAAAYGWSDIDLGHDFHEVDYLPEEDRIRFTLHPDARREVLSRLLQLNHERHAAELIACLP